MSEVQQHQPCYPMLLSWGGVETTCFWPDEIDTAEGLLPFAPVRPCDAVQHHTLLPLTQVLLTTLAGPYLGKPVHAITYIFGSIPGIGGGIPEPSPPEPKFVVVSERAGAWNSEPRLNRTAYHMGAAGSAEHRTIYGNWHFQAALPGGSSYLDVTANFGQDMIESIARTIVGGAPLR